jgi:TonB family protein
LRMMVLGAVCTSGMLMAQAPAKAPAKKSAALRISADASAKQLLTRAEPVYPEAAKTDGIAGPVELQIVVGTDGSVKRAVAVSGAKELRKAAVAAVMQWKYTPFTRNDKPIEVETKVIVSFTLEGMNN